MVGNVMGDDKWKTRAMNEFSGETGCPYATLRHNLNKNLQYILS
jgi:hypothetical protein